ncbi:MAG: hypothetical protein LBH21_06160 [Gracilibacteraceae bacterium]|nr:hypothetical protein [Gracilibacteraceae bacterium]
MKITDATWEKRNLGVTAMEVNLDGSETPADLEQIRALACEYTVARCPAGAIELMFKLEDMGYRYIETMFDARRDLKNLESALPSMAKRIAAGIVCEPMNEADLAELNRQLRLNIFYTDRVYVDPGFTPAQAARRYIGWIEDSLANGYEAFKCVWKGKAAGFFVSRAEKGESHVLFVGVYKEYENAGLGTGVIAASLRQAAAAGAKYARGGVSTNNMPSVNAHLALGYRIMATFYVYVKHSG